MRAALFDYGAGNLHSLGKALEAGGATVRITNRWDQALAEGALVLPGVGSFGAAVRSLGEDRALVKEALSDGYPCLGICLGMQLLFDLSEEGEGEGIGLIGGTVRRLRARVVPQMGWNDVFPSPDPLFDGPGRIVAYYANSFICEPVDRSCVIAKTEYEGETFAAAVRSRNSWGVQFHPEKSSEAGLRIIRNFLAAVG